jgi:hypothetical protein
MQVTKIPGKNQGKKKGLWRSHRDSADLVPQLQHEQRAWHSHAPDVGASS